MEKLPPDSFAAIVYWIFVIGITMILLYFLERVYRDNKKWAGYIILFPPLALIYIKNNWANSSAACGYFAGFYSIITISGLFSGYPMIEYTSEILNLIFLWPIFIGKWLIAKLIPAATLNAILGWIHKIMRSAITG